MDKPVRDVAPLLALINNPIFEGDKTVTNNQLSLLNLKSQGLKTCTKCGETKSCAEFHLNKRNGGYRSECKICTARSNKKWYENNKEISSALCKRWYQENKERRAAKAKEWESKNRDRINYLARKRHSDNKEHRNKYMREWRANNQEHKKVLAAWRNKNREKIRAADREISKRRRSTPHGKISGNISTAVNASLHGKKNGRKWEDLLGFTIEELMRHLEKQFKDGMSWDNYGRYGWHIDHKIPKAVFNFTSYNDIDFKRCWKLDNLQPMWAKDNWKKHATIDAPFQPSFSFFTGTSEN